MNSLENDARHTLSNQERLEELVGKNYDLLSPTDILKTISKSTGSENFWAGNVNASILKKVDPHPDVYMLIYDKVFQKQDLEPFFNPSNFSLKEAARILTGLTVLSQEPSAVHQVYLSRYNELHQDVVSFYPKAESLFSPEPTQRGGTPIPGQFFLKRFIPLLSGAERKNFQEAQAKANLTPAEYTNLLLIFKGFSNKEIATALDLSFETVKNHVLGILEKLPQVNSQAHVYDRTQAVAVGIKSGLIPKSLVNLYH